MSYKAAAERSDEAERLLTPPFKKTETPRPQEQQREQTGHTLGIRPAMPDHVNVSDFTGLRLLLLDVLEEVAGAATLLREGTKILENGEHVVAAAQACASDASEACDEAIKTLRFIALKCEEIAQ